MVKILFISIRKPRTQADHDSLKAFHRSEDDRHAMALLALKRLHQSNDRKEV